MVKIFAGRPRGPRGIQTWLLLLVTVSVLPGWMAAALVISESYKRERANLVSGTVGTARVLMQAVERDLAAAEAALQVLARSPDLASGDLAEFHRHAQGALLDQPGNGIVLADADGQQLTNTLVPYGEPLPLSGVPELLRTVVATAAPAVSDFYIGATSKVAQVAVGVPVLRDDRVAFVLTMGLLPDRLGALVRRQRLPADWIVSILDSKGTIVARTLGAEQFVGRQASAALLNRLQAAPEGFIEGATREGIAVLASFSRSSETGWTVSIGIPTAGLTAQLHRLLWLSVVGAGVLFLIGLMLARFISARIAGSIRALSAPALALASGAPISVPPAAIKEAEDVGHALMTAASLLEERTAARSEAERAERDMAIAKESAERSSKAKSEFLAMMSHELRTPLNAILGFAEMIDLRYYGPLTDKQKEYVQAILASGNHLLKLINDILELTRIEAGRVSVSLEPVELVPVVEAVVASVTRLAQKSGIAIEAGAFGLGLPPVSADRLRLAQCLINLCTNAIKYNRPQGTVTLSYEREGDDRVRLSVADTGIGIPQDRQAELFQLFNRLGADGRAIEGTGIGLAVTRGLVEAMGGTLGFVSTPGEGSRFWIDLPIHRG